MVFQFNNQQKLVEGIINAFLCIKPEGYRRTAFSFVTNKGTKLDVSIQTDTTYMAEPAGMFFNFGAYKSVELHNANPNWIFTKDFINKYAEYPTLPTSTSYDFVTIEDLANEIVIAINYL